MTGERKRPKTRQEIDARLPAHITGARREHIIKTFLECEQFEKNIHNRQFDDMMIWLEDNMFLRKVLFGQEAAENYVNEVCAAWVKNLHASEETAQELRTQLTALLRLMT